MSKIKSSVLAGVFICTPLVIGIQTATAQPVPGGTLDPLSIPKYVTPLVIPPVLHDDGGAPMEAEVALRQINQQVLPAGFPATPLWAYGDPARPATFNNPGFTIEVTKDTMTQIAWRNELVVNPNMCNNNKVKFVTGQGQGGGTAQEIACNFLPHIIQDQNGVPIVDQTLHWAAPNQDCLDGIPRTDCRGASDQPYMGPIPMVTHVHGAHVGPVSDGYPEAWWLPPANNVPSGYAASGTFFDDLSPGNSNRGDRGFALFEYTNDQPTTTLWYHDHSLGMTRLNVYAAGAGFWLIRDANDGETGLVSGTLPGPAPRAGNTAAGLNTPGNPVRRAVREIPIAIQPKSFNANGTQYYPADRAFFEGLGTGGIFADNTDVNIPFLPQSSSDIAPVWTPEAFFNTMVVNGRTWPQLEVASERYRLRFVNASDSRFLNLALTIVSSPDPALIGQELPFYQIGSEQGLLPAVVRIETGFATTLPGDGSDVGSGVTPVAGTFDEQALLMGPAERPDVIVDFTGLPDGTVVRMINTAPDAPFGGFPDVPADPDTTGQVMQFAVNQTLNNPNGDPSTPAASLVLDANPGGVAKLGAPDAIQDLALLEEESALICVFIDAVTGVITQDTTAIPPLCDPVTGSVPFGPKAAVLGVAGSAGGEVQLWDDPIGQNPALGAIEQWDMWNWSADAHPIHLHLVKFEVIERQIIGGAARPAEPWEAGWKDTVIAYPGEVTRVKALFDVPGLYVWHCHILSHEDNEMMVPYCVGEAGIDCPVQLF